MGSTTTCSRIYTTMLEQRYILRPEHATSMALGSHIGLYDSREDMFTSEIRLRESLDLESASRLGGRGEGVFPFKFNTI